MGKLYDVSGGAYEAAKKAYVVEGSKYVKLPKAFVVEGGKYVKLWSGSGKFVAVSNTNTTLTSEDGMNWTFNYADTTGLSTYPTYGIASGNGVFVVIKRYSSTNSGGGGVVFYSHDGITWTQGPTLWTSGNMKDFTFCNGKFICIDGMGYVRTSTDGISWTNVGAAKAGGYGGFVSSLRSGITYAKYNNSYYYICCADNYSDGNYGPEVLISTDLINWTSVWHYGYSAYFYNRSIVCIDDTAYIVGMIGGFRLIKVNPTATGITYVLTSTGHDVSTSAIGNDDEKVILATYAYNAAYNPNYYQIGVSTGWTYLSKLGSTMFPCAYCGGKYFASRISNATSTSTYTYLYYANGFTGLKDTGLTLAFTGQYGGQYSTFIDVVKVMHIE